MGYTIAVDNYFNSYRLAKYLLERQTLLLGTIQQNRGVPVELKMQKMAKHNSKFYRCRDVLFVQFSDQKASGVKNVFLIDSAGKHAVIQVLMIAK